MERPTLLSDPVHVDRVPSPSQRRAIEAEPAPLLVLAGPGAGKTFCLTERIRFLIEHHHVAPARICAFTFTNKAADEIGHRLASRLGDAAGAITSGTIHAFCANLLRTHGRGVGLDPGFGIADEEYQLSVLRRLEGPKRWHRRTLGWFSAHRFRGEALLHDNLSLFDRYELHLARRNVLDFDMLVLKAAELFECTGDAAQIRRRFDVVLVDEFQDLNPVQYRIVHALARDHRHVFAVGDDEQSIYSWAGADPSLFKLFLNDFGITREIHLEENRRCPRDVFAHARRLVSANTPIFAQRVVPRADRKSAFPVVALGFATDDDEADWIIRDITEDRARHDRQWGDYAVLYRTHQIGQRLETTFLNAGIPCRLAQGRALADDKAVAYVLAAARVIARPNDDVARDAFLRRALDRPALSDEAQAKAAEKGWTLRRQLNHMAAHLKRADAEGKRIRRALVDCRNLEALGKQHSTVAGLVQELLSRRVVHRKSVLDERQDEISDPASLPDVVRLAARLSDARASRRTVWIPPMRGADIAIKGMLAGIGIIAERGDAPPQSDVERLDPRDVASIGLPLGVFKAAQLVEMGDAAGEAFANVTTIDLETTDRNAATAEVVEIAASRVRDGEVVDTFSSLVRPRGSIQPGALAVHGISMAELEGAPAFEEVWPRFRAFVGSDVAVAHNGYDFDFRILRRLAEAIGARFDLCTYDTLPLARDLCPASRRLPDLAQRFRISTGQSHRALDDTVTLARVLRELETLKQSRARKTALADLLDHLGVALALYEEDELCAEASVFRGLTRVFALGRYSTCLEWYEREQAGDASMPSVDEVIERLGGTELMLRIRAEKTAEERYPVAMMRLRRLIAGIADGPLGELLSVFLERAVLSQWEGHEPVRERVNLLTLHSTKGLEFSRVYIAGAEDAQLPGGTSTRVPTPEEIEESRRLLYVGMTRTVDRLVLTRAATRAGRSTGGHRFLDEMGLAPVSPQ